MPREFRQRIPHEDKPAVTLFRADCHSLEKSEETAAREYEQRRPADQGCESNANSRRAPEHTEENQRQSQAEPGRTGKGEENTHAQCQPAKQEGESSE